ncbi:MAG: DNA repair protein RecO [Candidatus Omnitrophica bacterium]|nr:DNA repair protein RecO [Candidatus Omnitrophota bacterium]
MPIDKAETIVLRRRDFRETSLIVDFYSRERGKFSGLLKGIRADPSKFASNLELFSHNDIIFYPKADSSLYLVSQCDIKNNFPSIRQDLSRVGMASFMVELLDEIVPQEDKNEEIFRLLLESLAELEHTLSPGKIAMIFKIKILALSGFKPHFDSCLSCAGRIMDNAKFSLSLGGLLCPGCFAKDPKARSIFKGTVASILYIERNEFKNTLNLGLNPQIKKELDMVLNSFLNFHLEKELKTQKVINKIALVSA